MMVLLPVLKIPYVVQDWIHSGTQVHPPGIQSGHASYKLVAESETKSEAREQLDFKTT